MAENQTLEQQNDALTKQVADLKTKSDQKDTTINELKDQLKTQGRELTAVTKERDQAVTQRDGFRSTLSEKVERIRELEGEAEANEEVITRYEAQQKRDQIAADTGNVVVSHEGQNYRVLVPQFHFEDAVVKAAELATDAATVAKLIATRSGVLEAV